LDCWGVRLQKFHLLFCVRAAHVLNVGRSLRTANCNILWLLSTAQVGCMYPGWPLYTLYSYHNERPLCRPVNGRCLCVISICVGVGQMSAVEIPRAAHLLSRSSTKRVLTSHSQPHHSTTWSFTCVGIRWYGLECNLLHTIMIRDTKLHPISPYYGDTHAAFHMVQTVSPCVIVLTAQVCAVLTIKRDTCVCDKNHPRRRPSIVVGSTICALYCVCQHPQKTQRCNQNKSDPVIHVAKW
jgi:hypothetical protein